MKKDPNSLKRTLLARFNRKGGSSKHTMPFDDLAPSIKQGLLAIAELKASEIPIIASVPRDDAWVLITTGRVIWQRDGNLAYIENDSIQNVTVDLNAENQRGARQKNDFVYLKINDAFGQEHLLEIEAGAPYLALWNVLKFFQNQTNQFSTHLG